MNTSKENSLSVKTKWAITGALTFILLIFYQLLSDLVEGIYTLDLLNTQLDAKAAGLLFFFSSIFIWIIPFKRSKIAVRIVRQGETLFQMKLFLINRIFTWIFK